MIFKKKPKKQVLRDAPESQEYKKNLKDLNMDFNSEKENYKPSDMPRTGLPPLDKELNRLEMPPKQEKKIKSREKEIFVKIDNFKSIVQSIENMEKKIKDLENLIGKMQKLNDDEVSEINSWKSNLDDLREEMKNVGENLAKE